MLLQVAVKNLDVKTATADPSVKARERDSLSFAVLHGILGVSSLKALHECLLVREFALAFLADSECIGGLRVRQTLLSFAVQSTLSTGAHACLRRGPLSGRAAVV